MFCRECFATEKPRHSWNSDRVPSLSLSHRLRRGTVYLPSLCRHSFVAINCHCCRGSLVAIPLEKLHSSSIRYSQMKLTPPHIFKQTSLQYNKRCSVTVRQLEEFFHKIKPQKLMHVVEVKIYYMPSNSLGFCHELFLKCTASSFIMFISFIFSLHVFCCFLLFLGW